MKLWPFSQSNELPPIGKNCAVYFDQEQFLICAEHYAATRAMNGPGKPFQWLDRKEASPETVGTAVERCLNSSRSDLSLEECELEIKAFCDLVDVKQVDDFAKKFCYLSLHEQEDSIEVMLWHPSSLGGYTGLKDEPKYSSSKEVCSIGETVLEAANNLDHVILDEGYLEELGHD